MVIADIYGGVPCCIIIPLSPDVTHIRPVVPAQSGQVAVNAQIPVIITYTGVVEIILVF